MIKRIFKAIRNKISPPIRKCICGEHYCCFRHNYKIVGDGVAHMLPRAMKCKRMTDSINKLREMNITKVQ